MGLTTHGQNTNAAARFNLFIFDFQTEWNLHSANAVKGIEMHKERLQIYLAKWKFSQTGNMDNKVLAPLPPFM